MGIRQEAITENRKAKGTAAQRAIPLLFALFVWPVVLARWGRQRPAQQPAQPGQKQKPGTQPAPDSRPRQVVDEGQNEAPLKLSADLVTVITSVTDAAGNQVNDL